MKSKCTLLVGISLMILLLSVSCHSETEPTATTPPIELIPSIVASLPSLAPTDTVVAPATSSSVPKPIPLTTTAPETLTLLSTLVVPTLTPLPTLVADELEVAVAELLANPMNCDMPCWWGAIPGITTINEIKHALTPYNFDIYEYQYEDGDEQITALRVGIGYDEERNDFNIRMGYGFSNSILIDVSAYSPAVSEILTKYGQPDEVWLETMSSERESLPVRLNLVYLQAGMAVGYVVDGDIQDDVVIGCFADEEMGRLRLITPDTATSYEDFPTIFEEDRRYLPLEEATGLTMVDFIQRFRDPNQSHCLETPAELWE